MPAGKASRSGSRPFIEFGLNVSVDMSGIFDKLVSAHRIDDRMLNRFHIALALICCIAVPLFARTQSVGVSGSPKPSREAVQRLKERPRSLVQVVDAEKGVFIVADSLSPVQGDVGMAVYVYRWNGEGFDARPLIHAEPPLAIDVEVHFHARDRSLGFAYVDARHDYPSLSPMRTWEHPERSYLHMHVFEWKDDGYVETKHICGDVFWE